jgi:hypothetical protein
MPLAPAQKRPRQEQREQARARASTYFGANDEYEEHGPVPTFPDGEKVQDDARRATAHAPRSAGVLRDNLSRSARALLALLV